MLKEYLNNELFELLHEFEKKRYCVFYSYAGHVGWTDIHISLNKFYYSVVVFRSESIKDKASMNKLIKDLRELLQSEERYYHKLDWENNVISKYSNLDKKPRASNNCTIIETKYKVES